MPIASTAAKERGSDPLPQRVEIYHRIAYHKKEIVPQHSPHGQGFDVSGSPVLSADCGDRYRDRGYSVISLSANVRLVVFSAAREVADFMIRTEAPETELVAFSSVSVSVDLAEPGGDTQYERSDEGEDCETGVGEDYQPARCSRRRSWRSRLGRHRSCVLRMRLIWLRET